MDFPDLRLLQKLRLLFGLKNLSPLPKYLHCFKFKKKNKQTWIGIEWKIKRNEINKILDFFSFFTLYRISTSLQLHQIEKNLICVCLFFSSFMFVLFLVHSCLFVYLEHNHFHQRNIKNLKFDHTNHLMKIDLLFFCVCFGF